MTCEKYGKTFNYNGDLASHSVLCGGDTSKYRCHICGNHYSNKKGLRPHKKEESP